jgi:hypothetical protein
VPCLWPNTSGSEGAQPERHVAGGGRESMAIWGEPLLTKQLLSGCESCAGELIGNWLLRSFRLLLPWLLPEPSFGASLRSHAISSGRIHQDLPILDGLRHLQLARTLEDNSILTISVQMQRAPHKFPGAPPERGRMLRGRRQLRLFDQSPRIWAVNNSQSIQGSTFSDFRPPRPNFLPLPPSSSLRKDV